ncbi:DUF1189 domain-containing protein [Clostridium chauvoei]|uniref:DUF1189 domain-containing protein n=2 Tax=Clostridium chauvoei TaxID=46867 RepID=A0A1U6IQI3_9CLOT|nr:DUF1189 domain-containing protein [Clostridium chauvoei]ATD53771.1 hypothetical protein BTM20_00180 [Clostridium chauvoei]ATD56292.1 hypothetical protein BTM21_00180 [Clostridium chauvoei]MBX7281464.1 DUF1189 domain-containing protein [Clostridium chauvoei]MBX7283978.1 DUF1189 domain-containing protein [Clostridium chauvoei]MBX7286512.1 DUF1189 domain-containing protein [Clostridium chauvoei]
MKLNFITRMRISVVKIKDYPMLIKEGLNKALTYILIFSLIIGLTLGISQAIFLGTFQKIAVELLQQDEYEFEMVDGTLDFKASPYEQEEGSTISIFDTTKSTDDAESYRSTVVHKDMSVIFFKDGIVARNDGDEYIAKFKDIPMIPKYINNESFINTINKLSPVKYIVIVVMILTTYAKILFQALIISVAGMLFSKMKNANLKYVDVLKISLYSMTLPIILNLILPIGVLTMIISIIYVLKVINDLANKNEIEII